MDHSKRSTRMASEVIAYPRIVNGAVQNRITSGNRATQRTGGGLMLRHGLPTMRLLDTPRHRFGDW